jgi:hypothetical protein
MIFKSQHLNRNRSKCIDSFHFGNLGQGKTPMPGLADDYIAMAHNVGMNRLQSRAAKSGKTAVWKAGFPLALPPPPNPLGVPKGNICRNKAIKMSNIKTGLRYQSINRTTQFFAVFRSKNPILARKMPVFATKIMPYFCGFRISLSAPHPLRQP